MRSAIAMRSMFRLAAGCGLAVLLLAAVAPRGAGAHEVRQVGDYEFVVGFLDEPAFAGELNGLDLRVTLKPGAATPGAATPDASPAADGGDTPAAAIAPEGTPVEGLDETLQAEVIYLDQTMALPLRARYGEPGAYASEFFPTTPGDYSFRVFGTVEGVQVDETFTSGPETFGAVQDPAPLQFPQTDAAAVSAASTDGGFEDGPAGIGLVAAVGAAAAWSVRQRIVARRDRASHPAR
ncbi:MAG: hypothetical protein AVDCRST_MAG49-1543 [uncultured Thermomicrobiales bacterium]|uniref:Uncharacterized protein n=1 Tax=uncultured Thermomicrobiales bacterium TaxID=1645740 RepID=A0A6J4UHT0_9BACT|nr:MAG: hypothetical protein AVDCRST_MAG49-1543 [uncultured Thermomicrobiales bacterium]